MLKGDGLTKLPEFTFNESSDSDIYDVEGYPDIMIESQKGNYSTKFDDIFDQVRNEIGVPMALLKAHAKRESNFNQNAIRNEPAKNGRPPSASYGLMQVLWWTSSNRFSKWSYPDDILNKGVTLYDPLVNVRLGAHIIKENLDRFGNLRDAVNAYNTGVKESVRPAPNNYVNDVIKIYSEILGKAVT